jgi:hypothetical protein|tara:strand:- start:295 stop:897 length:603 start_codon:yes stop_codon:yes gene_type:complete
MVLYMHVILFFICINFGLGITTIPNTPLTLTAPIDEATGLPREDMECFKSFQVQALIVPVYHPISATHPDTNGDGVANDHFLEWTSHTGSNVPDLGIFYDGTGTPITGNMTGGFNPITEAIEASYQAGETLKGIFLGGYITGILGSMSMQCDTNPENEDTYGTAVVSPVMMYITYFINIVFGIMLTLALIFLITGKSFGI